MAILALITTFFSSYQRKKKRNRDKGEGSGGDAELEFTQWSIFLPKLYVNLMITFRHLPGNLDRMTRKSSFDTGTNK